MLINVLIGWAIFACFIDGLSAFFKFKKHDLEGGRADSLECSIYFIAFCILVK